MAHNTQPVHGEYGEGERISNSVDQKTYHPVARVTEMTSGNEWIERIRGISEQRCLFGQLWYEGEICILFADTNVGKSILAVQIADMISKGSDADGLLEGLAPETEAQPVIYADFEMSLAQFARRYSSGDGENREYHEFAKGFSRIELSYGNMSDDAEIFAGKDFADLIISDLENRVEQTGAKVLIVDNITFLASGTETAADAQPLMKKLIMLKKRHGLSMLVLAHTPKRDQSKPLTVNDIQGSKSLINFADSAFAIGKSRQGDDVRYIKQIKQRNTGVIHGSGNVIVCRMAKVASMLGLMTEGYGRECEHLSEKTRKHRQNSELPEKARELRDEGLPAEEIAARLGVARATIFRWLKSQSQSQ